MTNVLGPARSGYGIGAPVPSSVTLKSASLASALADTPKTRHRSTIIDDRFCRMIITPVSTARLRLRINYVTSLNR